MRRGSREVHLGPPKLVLSSHPDKSGDQDLLRGLGAIYGGENRPFPSEPLPGTPSHPAPSQERHSQASSSRKASRHALWRVYYVPVHKRVRATPPLTGSIDPCDNGSLAGERPLLRVIGWGVSGFAPLPWGMMVTAPPAQETPCPSGSPPGPQPSQQHFPSVPPPQPQVLRGQEARKDPSYKPGGAGVLRGCRPGRGGLTAAACVLARILVDRKSVV